MINGAKTFISNGILCDLCIVAARTENAPDDPAPEPLALRRRGETPGFVKGKKLKKMGMASQDTAELYFEDCRVPAENLLGEEGARLHDADAEARSRSGSSSRSARRRAPSRCSRTRSRYCQERKAFGKPIAKFQNTQFKLAECATEVEVGRAFLDRLVAEHVSGQVPREGVLDGEALALGDGARGSSTRCLQFFGGYGYMLEYPVSRAYMDARVQRIFAGTNEIMKMIIAKQMGL